MKKKSIEAENFIMSPKVDFVFKYIFGNEKDKDVLISLLSAVLGLPKEEFKDIEIINNELLREFKEDKKGILDIRAKLKNEKQIDIEIQILPTEYMPQRTLYYWSKMYSSQAKAGDPYSVLKKCITINIVDFKCIPIDKVHTSYHITEDETGHKLTELLEIHFLELPKLFDDSIKKDEDDPVIQWMEFIDGESKGVMEMLAKKNKEIKKAFSLLEIISNDEKARMLYEAREAEMKDQVTRLQEAEEKGIAKGIREGMIEVAIKLLGEGVEIEFISRVTGLSKEQISKLKEN